MWAPLFGLAVWLYCLSLGPVQGGKVLVLPVDGSHWLSMKVLVQQLILRDHEVVVLVPETSLLIHSSDSFRTEVYPVPYTQTDLDATFKELKDSAFQKSPGITELFDNMKRFMDFTSTQVKSCESLLDNRTLVSRMQGESFDIVLTDPFLPCGPILAYMFNIPAVYYLTGLPCELDMKAAQCPSPPSFVPVAFSGNSDVMNFPQRVINFLMAFVQSCACHKSYASFTDLVRRKLDDSMSYKSLLGHGAIWLMKNDFTFEWPRPIMPNMVFIGGINCAKRSPLPADLEEFVDDSGDDGFIIFTLGSMVSQMPKEKAKVFFDAFRQIPQKVLWRYTGPVPREVPKNVKLLKWIPQNDLLGHPKIKLFITHGGSNGLYEGICNAVPMLMFPLFGDQKHNVLHMVTRGVAQELRMFDVTSETLLAAIKKMISDKSYKARMATLSLIHHDRPVEPLDLAVFWTEFVMRHKGAPHLRVSAHELNWIQYHSLDVLGFLLIILVTALWLVLKVCLFCIRKRCRKATAKNKRE